MVCVLHPNRKFTETSLKKWCKHQFNLSKKLTSDYHGMKEHHHKLKITIWIFWNTFFLLQGVGTLAAIFRNFIFLNFTLCPWVGRIIIPIMILAFHAVGIWLIHGHPNQQNFVIYQYFFLSKFCLLFFQLLKTNVYHVGRTYTT